MAAGPRLGKKRAVAAKASALVTHNAAAQILNFGPVDGTPHAASPVQQCDSAHGRRTRPGAAGTNAPGIGCW